jgi:hypothetical protein
MLGTPCALEHDVLRPDYDSDTGPRDRVPAATIIRGGCGWPHGLCCDPTRRVGVAPKSLMVRDVARVCQTRVRYQGCWQAGC